MNKEIGKIVDIDGRRVFQFFPVEKPKEEIPEQMEIYPEPAKPYKDD